jgi:hypothetical protein
VTEDRLELLAAWYRRECRRPPPVTDVMEYADSIGMTMDAQDAIDLFHYINNGEDEQ